MINSPKPKAVELVERDPTGIGGTARLQVFPLNFLIIEVYIKSRRCVLCQLKMKQSNIRSRAHSILTKRKGGLGVNMGSLIRVCLVSKIGKEKLIHCCSLKRCFCRKYPFDST